MATLYLARRRGVGGFSRLVALKLIHPHLLQDPSIVDLFLDEARIAAGIRHPNVVHVEEVGVHEGSYFIAMEYVHGVSLAQFLEGLDEKRLRLNPRLSLWIIAQIAEALHATHEAAENGTPLNIVHRDVSPQNVLIGHTGHVKLIDFGIAKCRTSSASAEKENSVLGKLRYMSPEQLRLEPVSRRSDLYALGVMLWEMLTSRNFLRCDRVDDPRDWETRERPRPPSRYMSNVGSALDDVTLKALSFDPSERFATAFDLRRALLRADPSTALVDAPRVASLLRAVLGEELDRRMLDWPSAVTRELDMDASSSLPKPMEKLTVEVDYASLGLHLRERSQGGDESLPDAGAQASEKAERWPAQIAFGFGSGIYDTGEEELTAVKLPSPLSPPVSLGELALSATASPSSTVRTAYEELPTSRTEGSGARVRLAAVDPTLDDDEGPTAHQLDRAPRLSQRIRKLFVQRAQGAATHKLSIGLSCLALTTLVGALSVSSSEQPTAEAPESEPLPARPGTPSEPLVLQVQTVTASPQPESVAPKQAPPPAADAGASAPSQAADGEVSAETRAAAPKPVLTPRRAPVRQARTGRRRRARRRKP